MRMFKVITVLLMILGLTIAACSPAAAPVVTPAPKATAAATPTGQASAASPTAKPATPAETPKPATSQPKYGGTLTGWDAIEPEHLDIQQANSGGTLWPVAPIYNGLIQHRPAPPYDIIPELAKSWDMAPDGKSYDINLTQGVKWHDGQPFTSEDVKFNLDRLRNPPKGTISPRKTLFTAITSVETQGPDKVKINLDHPSPSIVEALASGWTVMMPKHVIEAKGDMKNTAIGTGPFKFKQYIPGTSVTVVKNDDYFVKGQPYLDGITWYIIKDKSVQMAAFRTKRVMMTGYGSRGLQPSEVDLIKKEIQGVKVYEYPGGGAGQTLTFNVTRPPFNDVRIRKAAVMALQQSEIIRVALQGGGLETSAVSPAGGDWGLPESELAGLPGIRKPSASDLDAAKKLLADGGFPNGLSTNFVFRTGSQYQEIAQVVKDQLSKIGVNITLQQQEAGVFQETQRNRNWDMIQTSHVAILNDPDGFLIWFVTGSPNNFSGLSDKQVDDGYAKQSQTLDPAERKKIVNDVDRHLMDIVPLFRLFEWKFYFAHWPDLQGYSGVGVGPMNNSRWAHVWLSQ